MDWTIYDSLLSDKQTRYQDDWGATELRNRVTKGAGRPGIGCWVVRIDTPDLLFATISGPAPRKDDRWIVIARRTLVE